MSIDYSLKASKKNGFDAWVIITHLDSDHFEGAPERFNKKGESPARVYCPVLWTETTEMSVTKRGGKPYEFGSNLRCPRKSQG